MIHFLKNDKSAISLSFQLYPFYMLFTLLYCFAFIIFKMLFHLYMEEIMSATAHFKTKFSNLIITWIAFLQVKISYTIIHLFISFDWLSSSWLKCVVKASRITCPLDELFSVLVFTIQNSCMGYLFVLHKIESSINALSNVALSSHYFSPDLSAKGDSGYRGGLD